MKKIVFIIKDNKKTILTLFAVAIFADVLFLNKSSDLVIFSILIIYLIFLKMFDLKSRSTFFISLALLIMMFVNYLLTGTSMPTEKAAVWLILFLIIGVIQQWRE